MKSFLNKIFPSKKEKDLKALWPFVDEVNEAYAQLHTLTDDELRGKTAEFKSTIADYTEEIRTRVDELKAEAECLRFEFMFARSMFQTPDMGKQRDLLNRVSAMLDEATLVSTVTGQLGPLNLENLTEAHLQQESGTVIGKNVLTGIQ